MSFERTHFDVRFITEPEHAGLDAMSIGPPTPEMARTHVPTADKLKYGLGIYGIGLGHISVGALSLFFYTEVMRLTPAQAGLIFSAGAIADVFTEICMGYAVSRTRSRLGHYRPWIIAGSVPFGLFLALLFLKPNFSPTAIFYYALATHVLFRFGFGMVSMPYTAMIARLSPDPDERASIGAVKAVFSAVGALTATYLGLRLVHWFGQGDDRLGFIVTGAIFGILCFLALLSCGAFTKEREGVLKRSAEAISPWAALRLIWRNQALLIVLVAVLLFFSAYTVMQAGVAYYFKYRLGLPNSTGTAFLMIAVAGLTTPLLWAKLVHRTSKRFVWIVGSLCVALALAMLALANAALMPLIYAMYFLFGAGNGALVLNYAAITADAIDLGDLRLGRRAEAYSFACLSVASRISIALGGALAGYSLTLIGFKSGGVAQSPATLKYLPLAVCALPAGLALASALTIRAFPLNTSAHREVLAGLVARASFERDAPSKERRP